MYQSRHLIKLYRTRTETYTGVQSNGTADTKLGRGIARTIVAKYLLDADIRSVDSYE